LSVSESSSFCAVFDIGKTNIKLSLVGRDSGQLAISAQSENSVLNDGDFPCANTEHIWLWLKSQLKQWSTTYLIEGIGITTHGATIACVAEGELVLPILDYEFTEIDSARQAYNLLRPAFDETLSPALPVGLNLGAQLHWLQKQYPEEFARTQHFLLYPQYWCYRLSGVAVSEMTSLGCHTDLWNPNKKDYSTLVNRQRWRELFPPNFAAGKCLGVIKPDLAKTLGLPATCEIYNGIHDSNASLVPHLFTQKTPFAVVSSGTWTIIAGIGSPTSCLDERKDMLANVNVFGEPTSCIRFMGGREWQQLAGTENASEKDFLALSRRGVYAIPAFSDQGGPFRQQAGYVYGAEHQHLSESEKSALATLYLALMTDHCLELLQQNSTVIIEGAFARNSWLMKILAGLRIEQQILYSEDATGTTAGTAHLSNQTSASRWPITVFPVVPAPIIQSFITSYKQKWQSLLSR